MIGKDTLKTQVGHQLTKGIIQSFFLDEIQIDRINVAYLKFDKWLHITTGEGETKAKEIDTAEPEEIKTFWIEDNSKFEYPLTKIEIQFQEFQKYIGLTLQYFNELTLGNNGDISCGLKLYFDNGLTLSIYSDINDQTQFSFDNKLPTDLKEK